MQTPVTKTVETTTAANVVTTSDAMHLSVEKLSSYQCNNGRYSLSVTAGCSSTLRLMPPMRKHTQ